MIELGCGTGLVGIVAAALGAAVTATDGEVALVELAALNYEANAHGDATGGGAAYRVVESDPGRSRLSTGSTARARKPPPCGATQLACRMLHVVCCTTP